MQQVVGLMTAGAQVVRDPGGPGGESGDRGPRADRRVHASPTAAGTVSHDRRHRVTLVIR